METGIDQGVRPELLQAARRDCGVARTLQVLDGKWTTLVVRELLMGPKRFGELRAALGDPSAKTLTDRLRALEHQGVLTRTVYAEIPPRVVYELTGKGRSLQDVLYAMLRWGDENPA
ncbi:winged helix-turn-helix transcriptional regulator [Actinocrispum wychmicini]|nr:helix-turn-helix domain-containing protein [Actinocrispum wychmicini]